MTKSEVKGPVINIDAMPTQDFASPGGAFKAKLGRMGPELGCEKLGVMLTVLEPGKKAFPFHAHHAIEEVFYIVDGAGEYRYGGETHSVRAGDVLSAPTGGPDRAHQIVNTGDAPLTFLAVSTMDPVDIVEYPDSKKWRVYAQGDAATLGEARRNHIERIGDPVDLFEGEED